MPCDPTLGSRDVLSSRAPEPCQSARPRHLSFASDEARRTPDNAWDSCCSRWHGRLLGWRQIRPARLCRFWDNESQSFPYASVTTPAKDEHSRTLGDAVTPTARAPPLCTRRHNDRTTVDRGAPADSRGPRSLDTPGRGRRAPSRGERGSSGSGGSPRFPALNSARSPRGGARRARLLLVRRSGPDTTRPGGGESPRGSHISPAPTAVSPPLHSHLGRCVYTTRRYAGGDRPRPARAVCGTGPVLRRDNRVG